MNRNGFTLIEMIVGMLVLTVGVLALASSTAFVAVQLDSADVRTERAGAQQQVVEQLRSLDFDSVDTATKGAGATVGEYTLWWDVSSLRWALKEVRLYTEGPAFRNGRKDGLAVDTLTVRIPRPVRW